MSSVVSQYVTQILCGNQGCLDFKHLDRVIGQRFTVADAVLIGVLSNSERFAIQEGRGKAGGRFMSPDSVIVAKTPLRVCQSPSGECDLCDNVHLCRYSVCGNCRFGNKCKHPHSLDSPKNEAVLRKMGLQELGMAEVSTLLLQNDPYLLPEICSHYNKGIGEHGSCRFNTTCTSLHLCLHFLQGDCKFGATCKRAHTFDAPTMKILNGRGFSPENIRILDKIYKNKFLILGHKEKPAVSVPCSAAPALPVVRRRSRQSSGSTSSSNNEADANEICLFFIRRHCSFKEKCVRVHYHLPYKWEILDQDGVTWKDLPNVEDIEEAYCNPGNDTSGGRQPVNFLTEVMTCGGSPVRRLSTASSVTKPPHFILTTEWLWYWRDELGQWEEYGLEADEEKMAAVTSQTLENVYLADADSEIPFGAGNHKYILYFKEMHQQNVKYKTKKEVRRRPRFISAQDVEAKLKGVSKESSSSSVAVPPHWDKGALPDFTYKLVPLSSSKSEYKMIESLFKRTMTSSVIRRIKRIQNPALWRVFQWQKEQMMKKNGGKAVEEKHLFHGTEPSFIDPICEQNFDWRICGVHGTHYGKGSYFARDASYSDAYAKSKAGKGKKIMFVALVLVGEFTRGNRSYMRPPEKGGTNKGLYDSCVDSENNPSIFVVFEKHQIYPEFIIEYSTLTLL